MFNTRGKQPAIPEWQDPEYIWNILERNGPAYVDRLGVLLGFHQFDPSQTKSKGEHTSSGIDAGPSGKGSRLTATWEARHSPLVREIANILMSEFGYSRSIGTPWKPDILVKHNPTGHIVLVEVKPDISTHNMITAIGQTICYRSVFKKVTAIIAAPGTDVLPHTLRRVISEQKIILLNLDGDLKGQLAKLSACPPRD